VDRFPPVVAADQPVTPKGQGELAQVDGLAAVVRDMFKPSAWRCHAFDHWRNCQLNQVGNTPAMVRGPLRMSDGVIRIAHHREDEGQQIAFWVRCAFVEGAPAVPRGILE
jgi:hypothetical protein